MAACRVCAPVCILPKSIVGGGPETSGGSALQGGLGAPLGVVGRDSMCVSRAPNSRSGLLARPVHIANDEEEEEEEH
eukprot:4050289-Prymnesium_polylepis.1